MERAGNVYKTWHGHDEERKDARKPGAGISFFVSYLLSQLANFHNKTSPSPLQLPLRRKKRKLFFFSTYEEINVL